MRPLVATTDGECSLGAPHRGRLVRPARLRDREAGLELFRPRAAGGEVFGTQRLVDAIRRAARTVQRRTPGGAPLRVGDLSGPRGGRLSRHHSHRNGRDADLIFFAQDAAGASVPAPGFVRYDPGGAALDPVLALRFDAARNWWLVEALVTDRAAGVARIFCAAWLRTLLLDWARGHGRPADVVARAALVLRQPGDSAPHDDHFHVRVACAPAERVVGCEDGAPLWWWLEKDFGKGDSAPADDDAVVDALARDAASDDGAPAPPADLAGRLAGR